MVDAINFSVPQIQFHFCFNSVCYTKLCFDENLSNENELGDIVLKMKMNDKKMEPVPISLIRAASSFFDAKEMKKKISAQVDLGSQHFQSQTLKWQTLEA